MRNLTLNNFVKKIIKKFYTQSQFSIENLLGLSSNFSRGDEDFIKQYKRVMNAVKKLSGQKK